ncbi:hypothetical protein, transporter-like protein [Carnobacterium sp. 17-4]|uniref:hypothetical protein n=1 Tax=Carnobacterium sp. (strain 17-4) TaxID=208596 RepID=UPI00020588D7|nr:hypothetical protein [Carnobacterium sp. 17-4]AEB28840.1 hypothetical protein, transporter-like protein [Carnobacterium sp. 17-4]
MNEEVIENKKFPWGAMIVYIVIFLSGIFFTTFTIEVIPLEGFEEVEPFSIMSTLVGGIIGAIGGLIILGIQYVFTKFPTQWISKEKKVYKYDIWSALFYSSAIGIVINLLVQEFSIQDNLTIALLVDVITTGLFLFFYFSGEEKEAHVKKSITIVQIAWLAIEIIFTVISIMLLSNLGI